jgi:hypothetical protein
VSSQSKTHPAAPIWEHKLTADPKISQTQSSGTLEGVYSPNGNKPPTDATANSEGRYSALDLWLHRLTVLMFVFVCAVVGVLLVIVPWRPEWTDNRFLLAYPPLRAIVASGFVRGLCSGLGVLDVWIGFWEAVHYHEGNHTTT